MNCQRNTALIILILIVSLKLPAQDLLTVIPPSATAASLGKYGEIPVQMYTGIPNISIPLYEIQDGPLNMPITLSYHAGGIKVEEFASDVGLGWTLNAGGIIGRAVRGVADESGGWITDPAARIENIIQGGNQSEIDNMTVAIKSGKDSEADIYSYNFNGQSGKFFFDQAGTVYNYPDKNILINVISGGGWQIKTEDGTVYEFEKSEEVIQGGCVDDSNSITTWFLTRIKSSDGKKEINLAYEQVNYGYEMRTSETKYFDLLGNQSGGPESCLVYMSTNSQRLKRIDFLSGYVQFSYETERLDLAGTYQLNKMEVFNLENELLKSFDFDYSYFGTEGSNESQLRLKLDALTEKSPSEEKPPYVFTYEESISMPDRLSTAQDHWGYYNGKDNNLSMVPTFDYKLLLPSQKVVYVRVDGADRNANPATTQACILKKIQYPTSGETLFTYENNTTSDNRIATNSDVQNFSFSLNQPFSSLTSPYETNTFTIPEQGAFVQLSATGLSTSGAGYNCDAFEVSLLKDDSFVTTVEDADPSNVFMHLEQGTYKFRFVWDCHQGNLNYQINLHAEIPNSGTYNKRTVGGLRIKQIEDRPGDGGLSIIKKYIYEDESTDYSWGHLVNLPVYWNVMDLVTYSCDVTATSSEVIVGRSYSNYPVATTQGGYVGYRFVIEDLGNQGEIHHAYDANLYEPPNLTYPFLPIDDYYWQRGSELNTKYYARKNDQLELVKEVTYGYTQISERKVRGWKLADHVIEAGNCFPAHVSYPIWPYDITTAFYALDYIAESLIDQSNSGGFTTKKTYYTYDPDHFQRVQEKETFSEESGGTQVKITYKKYPADYDFTGSPIGTEASGIKKLMDLHVVAIPIEEYVVRQFEDSQNQPLNERVISGALRSFKPDNPYPDQVFQLKLDQPVLLSDFSPSTIENNSFQKSNLYEPRVNFLAYDAKGNLLAQQKTNDAVVSYLWGYDDRFPVAQVTNAINASTTTQFPFTNYGSAEITEYISDTPILPAFEITSAQQISVTVGLLGAGSNIPEVPLVNLILMTTDGTPVSGINGIWGQNTYSVSVNQGVYQWYYSTGDISFSNPEFTSVYLNVSNAYSSAKTGSRIFYTSFEDEGNHTAVSYTGNKAWLGQYTVYLPANNGSYNLTYMKWNGGSPENWEYITVPVSVTSGVVQPFTIGDAATIIDEVRLYPADAQMTTYTYAPLVGLTTSADANCITTYYDYDSFGRLKHLKDQKRNIVKTYDYHYKGQQ